MHARGSLVALAVVVVGSLSMPAADAGNGIIIPPLEFDIGQTAPIGPSVTGVATDVLVGLHWASLAWTPTRFELGFGFISSTRPILEPLAVEPLAIERSTGGVTGTMAKPDTSLSLDGIYLELGRTIADRHHWRTWITGRGELLYGDLDGRAFSAKGVALRLQSEIYVPMKHAEPGAALFGTFAIGVYVEASHRDLPDALGPDGVTTGLAIRIPFMAAS